MAESSSRSPRARVMGYEKPRSGQKSAEKVGGALRYALIGALEVRIKLAREGRSHKGKKEGARYGRRERGNDFGISF